MTRSLNQAAKLLLILVLGTLASMPINTLSIPQGATVGIYAGPGTWTEGKIAIENFLDSISITWEELSAWDIDHRDLKQYYQVLWFPGGWTYDYKRFIEEKGEQMIRDFVASGGSYIGTCAGAYFASDYIIWEGERYEYSLDLFLGYAEGPIEAIAPWPKWAMTEVELNLSHPINAGQSGSLEMLYYGGPEFYPDSTQQIDIDIVGKWAINSKPAIIAFNYGLGKVLLLGPHPEIGFNKGSWDLSGREGAQWDWLKQAIGWILK